MSISLNPHKLSLSEGPIPDPLPALISELISYPLCEIDDEVRTVFARGGRARCAFCRNAPVEEVDHIIPIARGGPDRLENYAGVCRACNMRKTANILPIGILGILMEEAASSASGRRALIERRRADLLSWGETHTARSGTYRKRWSYIDPSRTNPDGVLFSLTCPDGAELGPFGCESAVDLQILKRERETCQHT